LIDHFLITNETTIFELDMKDRALEIFQGLEKDMVSDSKAIWEYAEEALMEFKSSKLLVERLGANGFKVETGIGGMETAFIGTWGDGSPIIGIIAEYDALPDCGPPVGENGHGCGHNLYAVASVYAAIVVKKILEEYGLEGTIKSFGCPAEETLIGKAYMARDGAFDGLDAVLAWHPGTSTAASAGSSLALDSYSFKFEGRSSHAGVDPWNGRSALDAIEVMNYSVNMMREHIPEGVRIHYVITDGGGEPNVVPPHSRSWYYIRAFTRDGKNGVNELAERVKNCAKAGALATDTKLEIKQLTGIYNKLPNEAGAELLQRNIEYVGPPKFTEEDREYSKEIGMDEGFDETISPISKVTSRASNDIGTVSWLAPLLTFRVACSTKDTPGHNILGALQYGSSIGEKGMMIASKVLSLTSLDLISDPSNLTKVRGEFEDRTRDFTFDPIIPEGQNPPIRDGSSSK
jgi:aminobenzoyl-glutamate utilization protein B